MVVETDPDGSVEVLHYTPVLKHRVSVVSSQVCGRHLPLTLFEEELDHNVRQEPVLLLMQTRSKQDKNYGGSFYYSKIRIKKIMLLTFYICHI